MAAPGRVYSRLELLDRLQGVAYEGYERTIDAHIKNIRRKIEPNPAAQSPNGKPPRKGVHPDECVALGAALLGDSLDQIDSVTLVDVLSMPIGDAPDIQGALFVGYRHGNPPPAEVAYEILAGAGKPLGLVEIAAQGAERILMPDAFVRDLGATPPLLAVPQEIRDFTSILSIPIMDDVHLYGVMNVSNLEEVKARDGITDLYGVMYLPPDLDPAKKYPLLVLIHGGPHNAITNAMQFRWNAQVFAAAGYVVVMPNPRGSTGYGQRFTDAIVFPGYTNVGWRYVQTSGWLQSNAHLYIFTQLSSLADVFLDDISLTSTNAGAEPLRSHLPRRRCGSTKRSISR